MDGRTESGECALEGRPGRENGGVVFKGAEAAQLGAEIGREVCWTGTLGPEECGSWLRGQLPSGILNITELLLPAKPPAGCWGHTVNESSF